MRPGSVRDHGHRAEAARRGRSRRRRRSERAASGGPQLAQPDRALRPTVALEPHSRSRIVRSSDCCRRRRRSTGAPGGAVRMSSETMRSWERRSASSGSVGGVTAVRRWDIARQRSRESNTSAADSTRGRSAGRARPVDHHGRPSPCGGRGCGGGPVGRRGSSDRSAAPGGRPQVAAARATPARTRCWWSRALRGSCRGRGHTVEQSDGVVDLPEREVGLGCDERHLVVGEGRSATRRGSGSRG